MKTCGTCKVEKAFDAFYARARSPDGRRSVCKSCEKIANAASYVRHAEERRADARVRTAEWRAKPGNAERNREAAKEWYRRPGNSERVVETVRQWRLANPEWYKQQDAEYRAANKQRVADVNKIWRRLNRERKAALNRAWAAKNPDKVRESARQCRLREPHKHAAIQNRRRARKLKATPSWANEFFILEAYHLAQLRTRMTGFEWHVDHQVPLNSLLVCGLHVEHNLAVIPGAANKAKSNRFWPDMP